MEWAIQRHGSTAAFFGLAAVGVWFLLRARRANPQAQTALTAVCVLMACQGFVGVAQYALELPAELVWLHVALATFTWLALLWAVAAAGRARAGPLARRPRPCRSASWRAAGEGARHGRRRVHRLAARRALLAAGDDVTVVDHLRTRHDLRGRDARGARLRARRGHRRRRPRPRRSRARAARGRLPPRGADRRPALGRRSLDRRARQRRRHGGGARGVAARGRAARACWPRPRASTATRRVLPTPESSPVAPLSPYAASKAAAETYMALFGRLHGLSTLSLRMANVYGPGQDPHGEAGVVAIFCAAARERRPVTIFGDGRADARLRLRRRRRRRRSSPPAAPTSRARSTSPPARRSASPTLAARARPRRPIGGPERLGEISRSSLDPSAAERALGWRARTPLGDGLRARRPR